MKIAVAGLGYVGTANVVMLAQHHQVTAVDLNPDRVAALAERRSPIEDALASEWLVGRDLDITATTNGAGAYAEADLVLIATPTDYDSVSNQFDTSSVESVIEHVQAVNREAVILIRSTIPVGYVERMRQETGSDRIIFAPEFLREGQALADSLGPWRIVVGDWGERGRRIADLLAEGHHRADHPRPADRPDEAVLRVAGDIAPFGECRVVQLGSQIEFDTCRRSDPRCRLYAHAASGRGHVQRIARANMLRGASTASTARRLGLGRERDLPHVLRSAGYEPVVKLGFSRDPASRLDFQLKGRRDLNDQLLRTVLMESGHQASLHRAAHACRTATASSRCHRAAACLACLEPKSPRRLIHPRLHPEADS